MTSDTINSFDEMGLSGPVLAALNDVGYETPSPIQSQAIPLLLAGRDLLGQAQTGTGKTAAFALPVLSQLNLAQKEPQVMVLVPTRELAIQVAEAFQTYAGKIAGFHVLPVYGGQDYSGQIRSLKRGVHVVVGTPGRVMDHMRRGTLKLDGLKTLILDEADEMLRMGFIEDVEWVLQQTPPTRQIALFSATIPREIRRIASQHLDNPAEITIALKTATADLIRQRYWPVSGMHKLDALTRILEAETFDGMIIFVRTRIATVELAEKLSARGFAATALNGDIAQNQRERTIERLKKGDLDILVATDVAARGLDVDRVSHVVNYDIPHDTEAYIHRIGRTGRAGRQGDAILFVAPRERRMLQAIERATSRTIEQMELPSTELINDKRIAQFKQTITDTLSREDLESYSLLIEQYQHEHNIPALDIAAALARLVQGDVPLLLKPQNAKTSGNSAMEGERARKRDRDSKPDTEFKAPRRDRQRDSKPDTEFKAPRRDRQQDFQPETELKAPRPERRRDFNPDAEFKSPRRERQRVTHPDTEFKPHRRERRQDFQSDQSASLPPARVRRDSTETERPPRRETARGSGLEIFRIDVGHSHKVLPSNIVGAIANEAGLDRKQIGRIAIFDDYSLVELPKGMPDELFNELRKIKVSGHAMNLKRDSGEGIESRRPAPAKGRPGPARKPFKNRDKKPDPPRKRRK